MCAALRAKGLWRAYEIMGELSSAQLVINSAVASASVPCVTREGEGECWGTQGGGDMIGDGLPCCYRLHHRQAGALAPCCAHSRFAARRTTCKRFKIAPSPCPLPPPHAACVQVSDIPGLLLCGVHQPAGRPVVSAVLCIAGRSVHHHLYCRGLGARNPLPCNAPLHPARYCVAIAYSKSSIRQAPPCDTHPCTHVN